MKRIAILGTGYVGLVSGACLAELGHSVVCCDTDTSKIASLQAGALPFYEPGLPELLSRNAANGRLTFTADPSQAAAQAELIFIAVGTPMGPGGDADVSSVLAAASSIGQALRPDAVVAVKSTVPAGTTRLVRDTIAAQTTHPFEAACNPEFLREGTAVSDFTRAERIVIGTASSRAGDVLEALYAPLGIPIVRTGWETAELMKYASNAFLAMKISFINNMAQLCEATGADVTELAYGVGLDTRIGTKHFSAGIGYGGSCFPKDVQALLHMAESAGHDFELLKPVIRTNRMQPLRFAEKVKATLGSLKGLKLAVLGLSFKAGTDDMRSAPSIPIIRFLLSEGAAVRAYDPQATRKAKLELGDGPVYTDDLRQAVEGSDACLVVTEWPEIATLDLPSLRSWVRRPILFDGRNLFSPAAMDEAGFDYYSIGRPPVLAAR
ncbi:UDP-glucose dehydrogenase family protein [Cohnella candidum]|uniref:UDP-glucose 6-dehydrogenase n=1 Tax=Cohnella candidum TaxID=2674991 RepID=A0A3G3K568_9BACL|nr:UDP-glucose/GDP-mannose dehydrogenase family protein [Cohnella candidum]AYQ75321.1 UDP-glucose/GDP-mannose dehydrogenase family protein [Cohnella candidum]